MKLRLISIRYNNIYRSDNLWQIKVFNEYPESVKPLNTSWKRYYLSLQTGIDAVKNFERPSVLNVNKLVLRAVVASNGDIYTLTVQGKFNENTFLSHYRKNIKIKQLELPRFHKPNMCISKNGDIVISDTTTMIYINKAYEIVSVSLSTISPFFLEMNTSHINWNVSAMTVNNQGEIIMVISYNNGARLFIHITSSGIKSYPMIFIDNRTYTSIYVGDYILLSSKVGIDLFDLKFNFVKTLITGGKEYFVVDTFNNIITIDGKELKGYSPTGKLLIQRKSNFRNIYDFRLYPGNHLMILYDNEVFGQEIKQKIVIL
jgi:hypothetical protein